MVVVYHANNFVLPLRLYDGEIAWRGLAMGYAGVEFFFVLSGFIMVHAHGRDFDRPERMRRYASRRFFRIYPIYWIVLAGLLALYLALGSLAPDSARDPRTVLASLLLLPSPEKDVLPVAWTLKHEVLFYVVFSLVFFSWRAAFTVLLAWAAACAVFGISGGATWPGSFFLSPYNILFLVGVLVASARASISPAVTLALLFLGVCGFIAVGMSEVYVGSWQLIWRTLCYGIAAALVVGALARAPFPVPRWLVGLGDASYVVYLVHLPAMNCAAILLAMTGLQRGLAPMATLVLLVLFSLAAGTAIRRAIEAPLLARLERRPVAVP
jgi:peptidoglycan/LPS O-acetylase OafA/YrhL